MIIPALAVIAFWSYRWRAAKRKTLGAASRPATGQGFVLMRVWVYVDSSKQVGDVDHMQVFADQEAADAWLRQNDPEGVAFGYPVQTQD